MEILKGSNLYLSRQNQIILKNLCFSLGSGEILTLVGPSGAGKTTFLNLLNRLADPDQGQIFFKGRDIREWNVLELRRKIGRVMQQAVMFPGTVAENILYGPSLAGKSHPEGAAPFLQLVGLPVSYAGRQADALSGGEQQRVALARTLANEPEVLLLDEPTSALDPGAAEHIEKTVLGLNREQGLTVVWITHNLEQARRVGTRTILLAGGEIIEEAPTEIFFTGPEKEVTRRFLAGEPL